MKIKDNFINKFKTQSKSFFSKIKSQYYTISPANNLPLPLKNFTNLTKNNNNNNNSNSNNKNNNLTNNKQPLVSIIMPAYNAAPHIRQAINSFFNQTYKNKELIIVDDTSTDNTNNIIKKIIKSHQNITLLKNSTQLGVAKTRNIALNHSKGEFIGHLDADDLLHKNAISETIKVFQKKDLALVYSNYKTINQQGKIIQKIKSPPFNIANIGKIGWRHFGMYRKDIALQLNGFNENLITCSDGDLFTRIGLHYPCQNLPKYLYTYRWHKTNIGHKRPHCLDCNKQSICAYFKEWKKIA